MAVQAEATYEEGVLKPSIPLPLREHQKIGLVIQTEPNRAAATAAIFPGNGDSAHDVGFQEIHALVERVEAMTREVFGGEVTYCEREDDEVPNDRHFTFDVVATGDVDAILKQSDQWHARLCELPTAAHGLFRLSIEAR
jgi:predicted DNA-binding antitoxin AbrB/MazE fold protein